MKNTSSNKAASSAIRAWLVLAAGVATTFYVWTFVNQGLERYARFKFDSEKHRVRVVLDERLERYVSALYGTQALFAASKSVEPDQWAAYNAKLNIARRLPGVRAFRFSESLPEGILVRFVEPRDGNERMLGFNQASDAARLPGFERARDTGEPSMTPQATFVAGGSGFLLVLPVYANGADISSVESRRAALVGYVDTAVESDVFFRELTEFRPLAAGFDLRINDGDESAPLFSSERVLFSSGAPAAGRPRARGTATLDTFGRVWTLHFSSRDHFFGLTSLERRAPPLVLGGGLAFSLLVFAVLYSLSLSEQRALSLAHEMTRESKALSTIVESADDAIFSKTLAGTVLTWNLGAEKIYGYTANEMVGHSIAVLLPEDRVGELADIADRIGRGYRIHNLETVRRRRDGTLIDVSLTVSPLRDESGVIRGASVIARDITAKKQGERRLGEIHEALLSSRSQQKAILDNIPDIAWLKDLDGRFIAVNEAFAAAAGVRADNVAGRTDHDFWPKDLADHYRADDSEVMRTGLRKRIEEPLEGKDGRRWIETLKMPFRDEEGRVVGTAGIARDISERREAARRFESMHASLQESEERYRSIVANFPGVVYRCAFDEHWTMEYMSPHIEKILGYSSAEFMEGRRAFASVIHPADTAAVERDILAAVREKIPYTIEYRAIAADGDIRWIWEKGQASFAEDGSVRWLDGAMLDVTENKKLETHVQQAQKMDTVGTLAGGIAHDLNNQLTPALGYLDLLQKQLGETHPAYALLADARFSTERCVQVVQRLLDFSHESSTRKMSIDVPHMMTDLKMLLDRVLPATIRVETYCGPALRAAYGNDSELQSALMNLAINARDAMPHGGTLAMRVENVNVESPPTGTRSGAYVRFTVRDTGCGMTPEVRAKVYEPFFTTKRKGQGTGLGLSMVFKSVRDHGGWIELDSEPGQGTTFRAFIPAAGTEPSAQAAAPQALPAAGGTLPGGSETVLFADDEEPLRRLGKTFLERLGYKVYVACDGEEAVRLYREHIKEIAAVVLDMTMPKMSGRQAFRKILEINPAARVILASGYTQEGTPEELVREGAAGFLPKPFTIYPLATSLRKALDVRP